MPRHELLNNIAHKDLRVILRSGPDLGDQVATVAAFPGEYADLQREYPIFFQRDGDSGRIHSVALLGLEQGENLFLQDGRWNAGYLPAIIAKGPFMIGFQQQEVDGQLRHEPVIHVDLDHPRASFSDGEPVFLPHGGNSPYLEQVIQVLRGIHHGMHNADAMFAALDAAGLIQPLELKVRLDEDHAINLAGLLAIDRERLAALDAPTLHQLHVAGYLEAAYLTLASQYNVRRLMAAKQRRLRQAR